MWHQTKGESNEQSKQPCPTKHCLEFGKKLLKCQKFNPFRTNPPMKNFEMNIWQKPKHINYVES